MRCAGKRSRTACDAGEQKTASAIRWSKFAGLLDAELLPDQ
jgi:hypothetical protein